MYSVIENNTSIENVPTKDIKMMKKTIISKILLTTITTITTTTTTITTITTTTTTITTITTTTTTTTNRLL
ncbi:hypothetical protein PIROE2DRAFT_12199 [Piromyces sp. E2]|nr:hypothetical protein PIROE2DRAFT_12199 [Piromyces sp. E2]|eukprot:OUM61741.1 hypothetical protein PIROE2DRAFT_12199 [Piromyces sp. E2]